MKSDHLPRKQCYKHSWPLLLLASEVTFKWGMEYSIISKTAEEENEERIEKFRGMATLRIGSEIILIILQCESIAPKSSASQNPYINSDQEEFRRHRSDHLHSLPRW